RGSRLPSSLRRCAHCAFSGVLGQPMPGDWRWARPKPPECGPIPAMAYLPNTINEVAVEYSTTVNRTVEQRVVDALNLIIRRDVAAGHTLESIYISSAADSHSMPSRHAQSKAVDISRINGKKMAIYYGTDNAVTAIVDAIQNAFE